jgi:hypothetical protein
MEAHRRKVYQTKEYLLSLGYVDYEKCIKYVQNILFIFLVDFPLMGSKCSPVLFAPSIFFIIYRIKALTLPYAGQSLSYSRAVIAIKVIIFTSINCFHSVSGIIVELLNKHGLDHISVYFIRLQKDSIEQF